MLAFVDSKIRVLVSNVGSVVSSAETWSRVLICPIDLSALRLPDRFNPEVIPRRQDPQLTGIISQAEK
jgi:hypothetical protein